MNILHEVYNWPEFNLKKLEDAYGFINYVYRSTYNFIQKG